MEIEFACRECGARNDQEFDDVTATIGCSSCGKQYGIVSEFSNTEAGVQHCGICGCRDLYIQKDFSRKVGCAIAAIGALLAPFTKMISLLVCALIDLILYQALPVITVCYRCRSIYREFSKNQQHEGFNLGINDRYRSADRAG
jgi:hypothetical protein